MKKRLHDFISRKKQSSALLNPYVKGAEGQRIWNDRYMNMSKAIRNWQLAFSYAMIVVVIMTISLARMANESKVQPFVVETSQGMPYAIKPMEAISVKDKTLINFALDQFIMNARSVVSDTEAEKNLLNRAYAFSADETLRYLRDYYDQNNPFEKVAHTTTSVSIVNTLPLSNNTWQVTWDETERNLETGHVSGTTRWVAQLTYTLGEVNPKFINENPFGLYITQLTWAKSQL